MADIVGVYRDPTASYEDLFGVIQLARDSVRRLGIGDILTHDNFFDP